MVHREKTGAESRSEEAYRILRQQLIDGMAEPGLRLTEARLALELGMSRIPVREALGRLEAEGLVRSTPYRGFTVPELDRAEIEDMIDIRMAIESYVAGAVTERISDASIAHLDETCVLADRAISEHDSQEFIRQIADFHSTIVDACGNQVLHRVMRFTANPYLWYRQYAATPLTEWQTLNDEHRLIVASLRARDRERVRYILLAHDQHVRSISRAYIEEVERRAQAQSPRPKRTSGRTVAEARPRPLRPVVAARLKGAQ